jgi:hypothetical protein
MMSKCWRERASEFLLHVYISELISWLHFYYRSLYSGVSVRGYVVISLFSETGIMQRSFVACRVGRNRQFDGADKAVFYCVRGYVICLVGGEVGG